MTYLVSIIMIIILTACATPEQRAAYQKMIDDQDHAECVKLGFTPKTDSYGDCRLRLKEMRIKANRPVYYPSIGVGYHHHHRHRW